MTVRPIDARFEALDMEDVIALERRPWSPTLPAAREHSIATAPPAPARPEQSSPASAGVPPPPAAAPPSTQAPQALTGSSLPGLLDLSATGSNGGATALLAGSNSTAAAADPGVIPAFAGLVVPGWNAPDAMVGPFPLATADTAPAPAADGHASTALGLAPAGFAADLAAIDALLADPLNAQLAAAYGGSAALRPEGVDPMLIGRYGAERLGLMQQFDRALRVARDEHEQALNAARHVHRPGETVTVDRHGNLRPGADSPGWSVVERSRRGSDMHLYQFSERAFNDWYGAQPGLSHSFFAQRPAQVVDSPPLVLAAGILLERDVIDLALSDPMNQSLIAAYGGASTPDTTGGLNPMLAERFGADRLGRMQQLDRAVEGARSAYLRALDAARANPPVVDLSSATTPIVDGPVAGSVGWSRVSSTTRDEHGNVTSTEQTLKFDEAAYTDWYAAQDGLANRAFAQWHGGVHWTDAVVAGGGDGGSYVEHQAQLVTNDGSLALDGRGFYDTSGLVQVDPANPPELHDAGGVWLDPSLGFVTSVENLVPRESLIDVVAPIVFIAIATFGTGAALGLTAASASVGGAMVAGAAMGAIGSFWSGLVFDGRVDFKDMLRGAFTGAVTAGVIKGANLDTAGIDSVTGNVTSHATRALVITGQATLQGALQEIIGGKFRDGFTSGLASGLAGEVCRGLNLDIDAREQAGSITVAEASQLRMLSRAVGGAINALANPDDRGAAFAAQFLGDLIKDSASAGATPSTAQEDFRASEIVEQNAGGADVAGTGDVIAVDPSGNSNSTDSGVETEDSDVGTDDVDDVDADAAAEANGDVAGSGSLQSPGQQAEAAIALLAEKYGGIDNIPAGELRALIEPLLPTEADVDALPLMLGPVEVAGLGDDLHSVWRDTSKQVSIGAGVIAGLFQGVGDSVIGLGQLALTTAQALEYLRLGGDTPLGRLVPGGKEACQTLLSIGHSVAEIVREPRHYLGAAVAHSVESVNNALATASASDHRGDWFLYGAAVGRVTFDVAGLVLGAAGLANGLTTAAARLQTFVQLRAAAAAGLPEFVPTASGNSGLRALSELTSTEPVASGGINATKVNSTGYALTDLTAAERNAVLDIVRLGDADGMLTESVVESVAARQGLQSLSGGKYGSNNGFDHVFVDRDGNVTLLIDSKQMSNGAVSLDPMAAGRNMQLSDDWVRAVLGELDQSSEAYIAVSKAMKNGTLIKGIAAVDKTSGNVLIIRVS
ncbi:hypothetical protein HLB44_20665 [Aquincola sp. S2]|uniref:Uncharacterized protein n=1 Tax=Pseudaquabacterium terrae TaxID=2732868 RepID=A0ABX2EL83_9BURK|nr:hypothetical protein [Aquabacterium terrae]NRF69417.1 hypothetical protein [Aquabacterium terrae]